MVNAVPTVKVVKRPTRRECNAVLRQGLGWADICCGSTHVTCGAAKLCKSHLRAWHAAGEIIVYNHGIVMKVKSHR